MIKECERPCPVCESSRGEVVHHQEYVAPSELFASPEVDIVICSTCGMCYADIAVEQAAVDETYAEHSKYADTSIYEDEEEVTDLPPGAPWDLDRLEGTADWLAANIPLTARVLDAGSATGALIGFLQRRGFTDLVGLDPSPVATAHVERVYHVRAIAGSFITPPEDIGTYDLVVLSHVLEHIADVQGAVAGLRSLVKPGGLVYIEVPDAERYHEYLLAPVHDFNTEHINHFSGALLTRLMRAAGFVARTTDTKEVLIAPTSVYPAVFGLYEKVALDATPHDDEPDPALAVAIRQYVRDSAVLLDEWAASLRQSVGDGPIVVWGAGQLSMKLLAGPLRGVHVEAIVDSAADKWGARFGDAPVIGPDQLDELIAPDIPVLVTSVHHRESIVLALESSFPQRRIYTLR